jgi:hypothetical protein
MWSSMKAAERQTRRRIEVAVEKAAGEWLNKLEEPIQANPTMRLVDWVSAQAMSLFFTYALIGETRRLRWLTVVLILLTAVLALLTYHLGPG